MRYALGIDGGGSKCDAVLIDETGATIGWGRGGPTHTPYDTPEVVAASFAEAVRGALRDVHGGRIWVAGYLPSGRAQQIINAAGEVMTIVEAGEVETAFASVQEDWGMVVLSGTGSFVHGRTPDGRNLHLGGLGPILGDYGSAYSIGLYGMRAAFAAGWTKARRTSLAEMVSAAWGVENLRGALELTYGENALSRRQVAALAKIVDQEATKGDNIAIRCIHDAADELADLAVDVVNELGMDRLDFPVIAAGSVAQKSRLWWERVCSRIAAVAPNIQPMVPQVQPAVGAALLALQEMGVQWTRKLMDRIIETQRPFLEAVERGATHHPTQD